MVAKVSAAIVAGGIILMAYLLLLGLPVAAAHFLPGVELNFSPDSVAGWGVVLLCCGAALWAAEMSGKWARAQFYLFPRTREHSRMIAWLVELLLTAAVFRMLISSLPIAALCALILMLVSALLENKFDDG